MQTAVTDDIINKTKFSVFQKGHYPDPLLALREVVSAANADVNDDDSEAIASLVHDSGTRWFKARPEDGLSFPLKPADLRDDIVAARCWVRDELMKQGVLADETRHVADEWCSNWNFDSVTIFLSVHRCSFGVNASYISEAPSRHVH